MKVQNYEWKQERTEPQTLVTTYSGLHKNWPLAYFEKIGVAVSWVNIKMWSIPHLKAFTATCKVM